MNVICIGCFFLQMLALGAEPADYFRIHVVDSTTGRGVPMVELRTTANQFFITDSNGYLAFNEPGLMNQEVFFHVRSHGYQFAKDGFGYAGKRVEIAPGGSVELKIERKNIAERLYRVTGYGIYRDSVLLGETPPIKEPLLNARVTGSDSVQMEEYAGRWFWFWGDTNWPRYPLGSFHVPGATSRLPGEGGLKPAVGIDLEYFTDENGFASRTAKMGDSGFTWLSGLMSFNDAAGSERMFAHFVCGVSDEKAMWKIIERGVMEWQPRTERFERVATWSMDGPFPDGAHTLLHDGYVYFCDPFPRWRVAANVAAVVDQSRYESFTCLAAGRRDKDESIDGKGGRVASFSWKQDTVTPGYRQVDRLVREGTMTREASPWALSDVASGDALLAHRGSVAWNNHRKRWVMIFGVSPDLGQIYYSEAKELSGPWIPARKIVTHNRYSFYNPVHHPELDQRNGREIYFEGTYTQSFSAAPVKTPLYDYNQIMYRLDLEDPRLRLTGNLEEPVGGGSR